MGSHPQYYAFKIPTGYFILKINLRLCLIAFAMHILHFALSQLKLLRVKQILFSNQDRKVR